jgi:hypothetical protein
MPAGQPPNLHSLYMGGMYPLGVQCLGCKRRAWCRPNDSAAARATCARSIPCGCSARKLRRARLGG